MIVEKLSKIITEIAQELGYEIDMLDGKIESIEMSKIFDQIGFPNNWRDIVQL